MRFPKIIRHRKAEVTVYGKSKHYPAYRIAYYAAGQRHQQRFATYSEARTAAERIARDIASGSQAVALSGSQARDALAALERLESLHQQTGRRPSLLAGISEYCEAVGKLHGHTLAEAVDGFLSTVASVKRMDLAQAAERFIADRAPKTKAKDGKRPQLSAGYHYNVSMWLREFAKTFPVHAGITFKELAKQTGLGEKTLHRMLNRNGNPTARNLGAVLRSIAEDMDIKPLVRAAVAH